MAGSRTWKLEVGNWLRHSGGASSRLPISGFLFPFSRFQFLVSCFLSPQRGLLAVAGAVAAVAWPAVAHAQGCAMCYTSASAAKKAGMEALQNGVFILFFPPLLIFAAILWQTFHRRNPQEAVEMEPCLAPQPLDPKPLE